MWTNDQSSQAKKPVNLKPLISATRGPTDGRQGARIFVAKRRERFAARAVFEQLRDILALLLRDRRDARKRLAALVFHKRGVANNKDIGMAGNGEIGIDQTRPARSVSASSQLPAGDARTPAAQMIVRLSIREPLNATPCASASVTALFENDLDAESSSVFLA